MARSVLYLHGVGERVRGGRWRAVLDRVLAGHGLAALRPGEDLLVPDYVDLLTGGTPSSGPPAPREATFDPRRAAAARPRFMAERHRVAESLGAPPAGRHLVPTPVYEVGRHAWGAVSPSMRHVEHYRRRHGLRDGVLARVLETLGGRARVAGGADEVVVLAHSLGSLVALDLLPHLPTGVRVPRLVTLGSPAGWPSLHRGPGRTEASFPYDRVGSWVNLHSPRDLVPLGRGSARLFPAAVDLPVTLPPARHGAEHYLGVPLLARVLADVLARPAVGGEGALAGPPPAGAG